MKSVFGSFFYKKHDFECWYAKFPIFKIKFELNDDDDDSILVSFSSNRFSTLKCSNFFYNTPLNTRHSVLCISKLASAVLHGQNRTINHKFTAE